MLGLIIWVIGVVLTIKSVLEIMKWDDVSFAVRILVSIVLLLTSWLGLIIYYIWGKDNLPHMLK